MNENARSFKLALAKAILTIGGNNVLKKEDHLGLRCLDFVR